MSYPDGTYEETTYDRLNAGTRRDRLGRVTRYFHNALDRLLATRDPAGRTTSQSGSGGGASCPACAGADSLTDGKGQTTKWERDVQGRVTRELRADGLTATLYTYEPATGRLKTVTDPKAQVTTYTYNADDTVASTVFTNAQIPTPSVTFTYDPVYNRVATMVDGTGTTAYTYKPAGVPGAGQVASVDGPLENDTITYTYDEMGRVTSRVIDGVAATRIYDALGRVTSETNVLGTFGYTYVGVTGRLDTVTYPNGQTSSYAYYPNTGDQRLQTIHNKKPDGATLSKFDYAYDAMGNILTWRQQADTTAVVWEYGYDPAGQLTSAVKRATDLQATILNRYAYTYDPAGNRIAEQMDNTATLATYDSLNRLVIQQPGGTIVFKGTVDEPAAVTVGGKPALVKPDNTWQTSIPLTAGPNHVTITATDPSGNTATAQYDVDVAGATKTFTYDANGNMTGDATRTFEWDAANNLRAVAIGPYRLDLTYDGRHRRVRVLETQNGLVQSDTRVIWCETGKCEERQGDGGTTVRRQFARGAQVESAARFFAADHLGSVTEVVDDTGEIRARYSFDPWGRRSRVVGEDVTGVGFTGHEGRAGLWFALYRAYDPDTGRWISDDLLGFRGGNNFHAYADNSPSNIYDPLGLTGRQARDCSGDVVYYICCEGGHLAVCAGPNTGGDTYVRGCYQEHGNTHVTDLKCKERRLCKGRKDGKAQVSPDDKAWLECSAYMTEMSCLQRTFQCRDVKQEQKHVEGQIGKYCPHDPAPTVK